MIIDLFTSATVINNDVVKKNVTILKIKEIVSAFILSVLRYAKQSPVFNIIATHIIAIKILREHNFEVKLKCILVLYMI